MPNAVILLSGGLDSTTRLAMSIAQGFVPHCLTFRYCQRHSVEIDAANKVAAHYKVARHVIADIDLRTFGGSSLTADIPVPKDRPVAEMETGVTVSYVPARNT